jgi:exosortase O
MKVPRSSLLETIWLPVAANAAILALWLWLFRPVYAYLGTIFTRQEFRTNQVVLLAALALVTMQVRRGSFRLQPDVAPQLYPPALAMALGGAALFILAEKFLDINTLSATLFGLASYGLVGLWLRPAYWRQGLPAALLLVGALPFGEHMETFIGYPVRLTTARIVSEGLTALGAPNLGSGPIRVETILVFENGISQVDNPCSGVKSLWTGGLFFLAATWIERRRVDRRWLISALVFAFFLLAANLARVAILVGVGQVLGWRLLAEMLHLPLGVIGFVFACAAGLAILRRFGRPLDPASPETAEEAPLAPARPTWLAPALGIALVVLALLYTPNPEPASAAQHKWSFPDTLATEEWPLSPSELAWLSTSGPVSAQRYRFDWKGIQGSFLLVASQDWRAQHRPERCFTVYGLEVQGSQPALAAPNFPLRLLDLGVPGGPQFYSAAYWLQSPSQVTDDYAARIWDDLAPQPEPWVLVTVLFDKSVAPGDEITLQLYSLLRQSVQEGLLR